MGPLDWILGAVVVLWLWNTRYTPQAPEPLDNPEPVFGVALFPPDAN